MTNLVFKKVFRYDPVQKKLRIFRLMRSFGVVGDGNGYSEKLAIALRPVLFRWQTGFDEWRLIFLGIDIHYYRSYGGVFV